jgi:N-acetylneuraminic acid mutarotase
MVCKNLNHLIFIIFQFFLLDIYGQFIPGPRIGQTAVLVRDKIYYRGGYTFGELNVNTPSDFFYLGGPTKTWVDLKSQGAEFPLTVSHTANVGCSNQDSIFIIGGVQLNESNLVYQFDTKTNKISVPIIKGKAPPRRGSMSSVSYEGKIYVFSGRTLDDNDNNIFFDNLDILDTINLSWGVGSLVNAPLPRFWYTATLVNEIIYYISGRQQDNASGQIYTPMSNVRDVTFII